MDCKYRLFKGVRVPITKEIISHFVWEQHKRDATPAGHKRHPHIFGTIEFAFVEFYRKKYGTHTYGLNKLYLMLEKQHNRGQDGAGFASVKLNMRPGQRFMHRQRSANQNPIQEIFNSSNQIVNHELQKTPDCSTDI